MDNNDIMRLAVGIENKDIRCACIYETYLEGVNFEIILMCRKYHLTDEQYELLLRTTAERMGLSELLDELESPGLLESDAWSARRDAQAALDGEQPLYLFEDNNDRAVGLPEDTSEWPIDLAGEHAMQV